MDKKQRILVSACLLGEPCRYDGASVPCDRVIGLADDFKLVPVCPEQLGGLPTPRVSSEIQSDGRVVDKVGVDRTEAFLLGAKRTADIALEAGCSSAILKSRSPSCGVHEVYDGTFSGTLVQGRGLAATALQRAGLSLRDENDV